MIPAEILENANLERALRFEVVQVIFRPLNLRKSHGKRWKAREIFHRNNMVVTERTHFSLDILGYVSAVLRTTRTRNHAV